MPRLLQEYSFPSMAVGSYPSHTRLHLRKGQMIEALQQHSWKLTEIVSTGSLQPVPSDASVTLQFEEERVRGKSACNRYFAPLSLDGSHLRFGPVGSTRMMCPEPLMTLESNYFAALEHVESYQLEDEQLTLYGGQGKRLLLFQRVAD